MDIDSVTKLIVAILTPAAAIVGVGGRKRRLRNDIREDLEIIKQLEQDPVLRQHTPATGWLSGKVALDVARLAGMPLGADKKPVPWTSVVFAAMLAIAFGMLTWWLCRDGFVWYAVFPATVGFLLIVSLIGMTTNREIPDDASQIAPGATPIRLRTPGERVAVSVAFATSGAESSTLRDEGQAGVALRFIGLARSQQYEAALGLADPNWILCRIQSWLCANGATDSASVGDVETLALTMRDAKQPAAIWSDFVASESAQFAAAWAELDPARLGVASRRRQIASDTDLVILAPLDDDHQGFFVTRPTILSNALVFLMRNMDGEWRLASHLTSTPPTPGLPPNWWVDDRSPSDTEQE